MENYEKQNALNDSELENVAGGNTEILDSALQKCLDQQAYISAARNRLDYTSSNLDMASLKPLKEKVIFAINDTNTDVDREAIQKEIEASVQQIDDNALLTFNGKKLNDR